MKNFDPDKFLAEDVEETTPQTQDKDEFNPDAFLADDVSENEYRTPSSQYALDKEGQEKVTDPKAFIAEMSYPEMVGEIASDQIPYADQLRAGTAAFYNQQMGDKTKTYAEIKNNIDTKQAAIQASNPVLANTTRIGTEAAMLATGAGLATKALKGIQTASKLSKALKLGGIAVGTDFTYNVAQELSQDDREFMDKVDEAFSKGSKRTAEGAAYGIALGGVFKGIGKAAKASGATDMIKDQIVKNNVGGLLKSQAKKLRGYKKTGRDISDIRKSLEEVGGDSIDYNKPMDIVSFVEQTDLGSDALKKAGDMQGNVVAKIDAITGETLTADSIYSSITSRLEAEIKKKGSLVDEQFLKESDDVMKFLQRKFYNPDLSPKMASPSQIMQAKKDVATYIDALEIDNGLKKLLLKENNDSANALVEGAAAKFDMAKASGAAEDVTQVTGTGEVTESLKDQFVNARKRYSDINLLSEIADASNADVGAGEIFSSIRKGLYTLLPAGRDAQTVGAIAAVSNTLLKSPSIISASATKSREKLAKAAGLGEFLSKNADTIPAMGALSSRLYNLFTDDEQDYASANKEFNALLEQGYSYKSLYENPVERTNMDARSKISDINSVISSASPDLARTLMDAHKNGEDLGPILVEVAKRPEAKGLFKEGVGWEGKVYSPEDKQQAISKLKSYPLLPTRDRMLYEENIKNTGNLPEWDMLPQREPVKIKPGNKGEGSY